MINQLPTQNELPKYTFNIKEITIFLLWANITRNKYRMSDNEKQLMKRCSEIIQNELTTRNTNQTTI